MMNTISPNDSLAPQSKNNHLALDIQLLKDSLDIIDVIQKQGTALDHVKGDEYIGLCPFHDDHTPSLTVNANKQIWLCRTCPGKNGKPHLGGDVFDFLTTMGNTLPQAIAIVKGESTTTATPIKRQHTDITKTLQWTHIQAPAAPTMQDYQHYKYGQPDKTYRYNNKNGSCAGYVCRFELPEGKETLPFIYAKNGNSGATEWRYLGFQNPYRPLYAADLIDQNPNAIVVMVEGEKCADFINELLRSDEFVATTWIGGAGQVGKTDMSQLDTRRVIFWPDNDEPGEKCMRYAMSVIKSSKKRFIKIDAGLPKHWDAADSGFNTQQLRDFISPFINVVESDPLPVSIPKVDKVPDYAQMLKEAIVSVNDNIEVPPVCIEMGNNGYFCTVGTLGNISLVIGKAKQGKTFAVSMVLAAAESGTPFDDTIRVALPQSQKNIILFDTEQSKYHVQRVIKRVCSLAGVAIPINLITYSLRSKSTAERIGMIEYALYNTPNVGLACIDGIRDCVVNINDPEESTAIANMLLRWTEQLNIHIACVLHTNKGDDHARGHIGTELTNKAESVISISKSSGDKEIAIVKPEYCRDKEFEEWAFKVNDEGISEVLKGWSRTSQSAGVGTQKTTTNPNDIPDETHGVILADVFKMDSELTRAQIKVSTKLNVTRWLYLKTPIGDNKADMWITRWRERGLIEVTGTPNTSSARYKMV
jgi:hypothetical protein